MAEQELQEIEDSPLEENWEERTLSLLHDSKIDNDFSTAKVGKRRNRKQSVKWMMTRPMAIPRVILELQDEHLRESALRCLCNFLLEKRDVDPENYLRTGHMLYFSCSTMTLLLQEVQTFLRLMADDFLTIRSCKRLINVLTLFQCIAANDETRLKFVESSIPNFLMPLILFKKSVELFENVRAVALSVLGILCQAGESEIIHWALRNNVVEMSQAVLEIGNELSKVVGMHIIESILKDSTGISCICSSSNTCLLHRLTRTLDHLISLLAFDPEFSPRLLFHAVRCYVLLCSRARGLNAVRKNLSRHLLCGTFQNETETGVRILEVLLEEHLAIAYVGSPHNKSLLYSLVSTWDQMTFLAFTGILLHIFRCYDLLCTIRNGLAALKDRSASLNFMRAAAHTMLQDHPEIRTLIGQVLHSLSGEDCRSLQYFHPESGNQIGFH